MSSLGGLSAKTVNYSDLVQNVESVINALSNLEIYMTLPNEIMARNRAGSVKFVIQQMVDVGRIGRHSELYTPINEFYMRKFNQEAPYYVARSVQKQKLG